VCLTALRVHQHDPLTVTELCRVLSRLAKDVNNITRLLADRCCAVLVA
jgi:hypothetical protein